MPRFDGTGPEGQGPGTGRRRGRCGSARRDNDGNFVGQGRGLGRKLGQGRGKGRSID